MTDRDGREVFSWHAALLSLRRSQVYFFLLLCRVRPGPFIFDKSLNTLADRNTTSGLYLYGSISPAIGEDAAVTVAASASGGNKLFVDVDFELRTKS